MQDFSDGDLLLTASAWASQGHNLAIAVVIKTWRSSPRKIGSIMIIRDDGLVAGSVSGGCVEGAVIDSALATMQDGFVKRLEFGVADATAWEVGLSCGGEISVGVVPLSLIGVDILEIVQKKYADRYPIYLSFDLKNMSVFEKDEAFSATSLDTEQKIFNLLISPRPRVFIIGAVHISQYLASMLTGCGYAVSVIDPRTTFAKEERFQDIELITLWPDEALDKVIIDAETAIITLTHDPKIDDNALDIALNSNAFYIAALGSKKTHESRCARFLKKGFDQTTLNRIHGPAGIDIGAITPAEIAASILSEIIAKRRKVVKNVA
ncbi:MAG: XdhC family protein [Alphaproteobacteria bacterium]|jgi:xanthine dehydrogenase accessory factor|nr:XdhC family protein [Alphaproteobacteria bacterium]